MLRLEAPTVAAFKGLRQDVVSALVMAALSRVSMKTMTRLWRHLAGVDDLRRKTAGS